MSKISNLIFHNKKHYITQNFSDKHKATDYGTHRKKINQYAIEDGIVTWTGLISSGKTVKIKYPRINKEFLHLHLDKIKVKKGQKVNFLIRTYKKIGKKYYYSSWMRKNIII